MLSGVKKRILLTIVALVILPTALLSLMAGRAVRIRELVIMQQMQLTAQSMTRICSERIESAIKNELTRTKSEIGSVLMRTASASELARVAAELEKESPIIDSVIVYHDPWEIIYPANTTSDIPQGQMQQSFIDLLRTEIAQSVSEQQFFHINDTGVYYCFTLVPGRKDLYAGFRIDLLRFRELLDSILNQLATEEILLAASASMYEAEDSVIVEDSLSPAPKRQQVRPDSSERSFDPLGASTLFKPFTDVVITAYVRNPAQLQETGRNQGKLLIWGIALLSGGILVGVTILIFQIQEAIRRTSARANYIIGISHDLRTPISSLKMMTESLYSGTVKDPEKRHHFLKIMTDECERLNRLVERVLYFVRYGEDALVFFKKNVDVKTLLKKTVDSFSGSSYGSRNKVELTVNVPEELPDIEADENAVTQVVLNLLDNAFKYGRKEGRKQQITVSAALTERRRSPISPAGKWIKISVADNGPGIHPSEIRKIFKPYFRAKSSYNANNSGVGLGLALCRHIIRKHNGRIEAAHTSEEGAVFNIYLPVSE